MMTRKKLHLGMVMLMTLCLAWAPSLMAAEFPEQALTIINPQAPGGAHDAQGRAFAAIADKHFGKPLIVVNKPGASTMIGSIAAAEAAPDGYTLLLGSSMTTTVVEWDVINGKKPPVTRDTYVTIGSFTLIPTVVSVPANSPWNSIADLVRDAKAKPGHYAFCSAGVLSSSHLGAELFARAYGLKFRHVPFKGGGPCLASLVGGHADFTTQFTITTIPLARGNKVRILATQSDRRVKAIPDVPTLKELGANNAEMYMWVGLVAPKKTPAPVVERLRQLTAKAAKDPAFSEAIEKLGGEVQFMDGNELGKFWEKESAEMNQLLSVLHKEGVKID